MRSILILLACAVILAECVTFEATLPGTKDAPAVNNGLVKQRSTSSDEDHSSQDEEEHSTGDDDEDHSTAAPSPDEGSSEDEEHSTAPSPDDDGDGSPNKTSSSTSPDDHTGMRSKEEGHSIFRFSGGDHTGFILSLLLPRRSSRTGARPCTRRAVSATSM